MNNDHDDMYTKHDHNSYHSNEQPPQIDNIVDDQRSPQLNTTICRYTNNQGNTSPNDDSGNETEGGGGGGGGDRGGGGGHFICLNPTRDTSPAPSLSCSDTDIEGEEGLELFKRTPSFPFLPHHHHHHQNTRIGILPDEDEYPEAWGSPSPSSMDVGHTSTLSLCRSFAQLSSLSGATRSTSTSAFLAFAGHGMVESGTLRPMPGSHHFIGHPIFLGHERAFCFNIELGVDARHQHQGRHHPYPVQLNLEDGRSEGGRSEFSYYDLF